MSTYLESYGAQEARRARFVRWIVISVLVILAATLTFYLLFRNYREVRQARLFLQLLQQKNYPAAYALWGCTPESPCAHYSMDKFMEDWGPKSPHADASRAKVARVRGCADGVIVEVDFGSGEPEYLWVDRATRNIGFAPWPVCNPRLPKQP